MLCNESIMNIDKFELINKWYLHNIRFVLDAVMKCKSELGEKDVECYIAETMKHVPAQLKKHVQVLILN